MRTVRLRIDRCSRMLGRRVVVDVQGEVVLFKGEVDVQGGVGPVQGEVDVPAPGQDHLPLTMWPIPWCICHTP